MKGSCTAPPASGDSSISRPTSICCLLTRVSAVPLLKKFRRKRWGELPAYKKHLKDVPALVPFLKASNMKYCKYLWFVMRCQFHLAVLDQTLRSSTSVFHCRIIKEIKGRDEESCQLTRNIRRMSLPSFISQGFEFETFWVFVICNVMSVP